jgi:hypothetical protein
MWVVDPPREQNAPLVQWKYDPLLRMNYTYTHSLSSKRTPRTTEADSSSTKSGYPQTEKHLLQ